MQSAKNEAGYPLGESRRFSNPQKVYVDLSPKLFEIKRELIEEMSRKDLEFEEESVDIIKGKNIF